MTSTRRIYQARQSKLTPSTTRSATTRSSGGQDRTEVVGGGAASRALAANTQRLERQQARQERAARQNIAIYRGGGEFSTLGGNGGYRPRGDVTSGGRPIGAVVPNSGGLMGGMSAGVDGDGGLQLLQERLGEVAQQIGPQTGVAIPTPNEIDEADPETDVFPRYRGDHYFQTTTRQTWQWEPSTDSDAGYWFVAAEDDLLPVAIESPAVQQYPALIVDIVRWRIEAVQLTNRNPDGSEATAGAASVLLNGTAVTLGETVAVPGDYLAVNVTSAGAGAMLAVIKMRQV
jgi:hypothetical protein